MNDSNPKLSDKKEKNKNSDTKDNFTKEVSKSDVKRIKQRIKVDISMIKTTNEMGKEIGKNPVSGDEVGIDLGTVKGDYLNMEEIDIKEVKEKTNAQKKDTILDTIKKAEIAEKVNSNKYDEFKEYTTLKLIEDLHRELNRYAFIIAKRFPEQFKLSQGKLSLLWGYSDTWIGRIKRGKLNTLDTNKERELTKIETIFRDNLVWKAINCLNLVKKFRNDKLSIPIFIDKLQLELGRIIDIDLNTREIVEPSIPFKMFSYVVWGNKSYLYDIKNRITGKSVHPNLDYKFSKENLEIFRANLVLFLGDKAKMCEKMINKYISINPDLKLYSKEQTNIKNKYYFSILRTPSKIKDIEIVYWYGILNADGALYMNGSNYTVYFSLKLKDRERVYRFAEVVGYDKNNVTERDQFRKFQGRIILSKRAEVRFGCKTMYNDILSQGFTSSHDLDKQIPKFVYYFIAEAKKELIESKKHWWHTDSGKKALVWLLGLYDGDGTLKEKKYGRLISGSEDYLNLIARTFNCKHRAKSKGKPTGFSKKESYYLVLGTDLFEAMLASYKYSMVRKRPT